MAAIMLGIVLYEGTVGAAEPKPKGEIWIGTAAYATASTACDRPQLNRAISFYRQAYRAHREAMWQDGPVPRVWYRDCLALTRRAVEWRERAGAAKLEYDRWHAYHYDWRSWLSAHWYSVGSCETGFGGPPNWRHSNSRYQGAFGFAISSWDGYVDEADPKAGPYPAEAWQATPRQQLEVALAIYRHFGMSGWGCKGHG